MLNRRQSLSGLVRLGKLGVWRYGGEKMTLKKKFKVNVKQRAQFEWLGWSGLTGGMEVKHRISLQEKSKLYNQ